MLTLKLDVEKKLIIAVSFFAVTVIIITACIIWPTISQIYHINNDTENLKKYLEEKHNDAMNLKSEKVKVSEVKETVAGFANYFYNDMQQLKLITELEEIAKKNNLAQEINSYELTGDKAKLTLSLNGEYKKLISCLSDIENLQFFINTDVVYLTPTTNRKENNYNMRLELSLYVNS